VTINNPRALYLLLLVLPLLVLAVVQYRQGKRGLLLLSGSWRFDRLKNVFLVKSFFREFFLLLSFVFAIFALADVRGGKRLVEDDRSGLEIVFALDISRSMLARDVGSARLDAMVGEIGRLTQALVDAQFGVVVVKGRGAVILPTTEDLFSLDLVLANLHPGLVTTPGSDIEAGIREALSAFREGGRFRAVVLFSDGEYLEGDPLGAAKLASERGIPIISVGVGSPEGAELILRDGTRIVDRGGSPVVSRLNRSSLQEVARNSGGKYYSIADSHRIQGELIALLKNMKTADETEGLRLVPRLWYSPLLIASLAALSISLLTRVVRWQALL
jgi:Ca-activated chloride channel family protein